MFYPSREFRKPDLSIDGFELWIYGRQFPESNDFWDANWLNVIARCTGHSSIVQAEGSILQSSELKTLLDGSKKIYDSLSGEAHLSCLEPNIDLKIKMEGSGHCQLVVSITPDHLNEEHSFIFDLDQSYLPPFIQSLEKILIDYPLKGVRPRDSMSEGSIAEQESPGSLKLEKNGFFNLSSILVQVRWIEKIWLLVRKMEMQTTNLLLLLIAFVVGFFIGYGCHYLVSHL